MRAVFTGAFGSNWLRVLLALVFAGGCAAAVAATHESQTLDGILKVRFGGSRTETRIVVDLERSVAAKVADSGGRLVLTLPNVGAKGVQQGRGQGLVKAWLLENHGGGARLSLELDGDAQVKRRFLLPPADGVTYYRYVVDIAARPAALRMAVADPHEALEADADARAQIAAAEGSALRLRKVIVIDAGHGGHDPGAQSGRTSEKDITLAAARALKARLERTGRYQVVMTRPGDTYVTLNDRVQIARRAGADLFISLHADSAGENASAHGASVYTLSDRGSGRVSQVLERNEWFRRTAARADDPEVGQILLDLTQRSTRNRSAVFAQLLLDRINDRVDLLPRSHRDAGYFVLLAPDVPAALLEMGFITSPDDQARLTDPAERGKLMDGVAEAIDAYFAKPSRVASR